MNLTELNESDTLARLSQLKQDLIALKTLTVRVDYEQISAQYADALKALAVVHRERKGVRDRKRSQYRNQLQGNDLTRALNTLTQESQQDSTERRRLKQKRDQALAPFAQEIAQADQQVRSLMQQYKALSHAWQAQIQSAYFAGLASGAIPFSALPILYQDDALIIVDKPAGLLSVPGRGACLQDSVLSRLRYQLPDVPFLQVVHRLDRDTSGLIAIATSENAHAALSQQFAQRQVRKTYEAILSRPIDRAAGTVTLPLWSNPDTRPRQIVDRQWGKPSRTDFKVLVVCDRPRIELIPHTGRTHQLRVHMAHCEGLNSPISGDALYGAEEKARLCLHAKTLEFAHPITKAGLSFSSVLPF